MDPAGRSTRVKRAHTFSNLFRRDVSAHQTHINGGGTPRNDNNVLGRNALPNTEVRRGNPDIYIDCLWKWVKSQERYTTPLHQAVSITDPRFRVLVVDRLLTFIPKKTMSPSARGISLDMQDHDGNTALHLAVSKGRLALVVRLLAAGASVDVAGSMRKSCLHLATSLTDDRVALEIVTQLLGNGASVHVTDSKGNTPLHIAISNGLREVVFLLIECNSSVNASSAEGTRPLQLAKSIISPPLRLDIENRLRAAGAY